MAREYDLLQQFMLAASRQGARLFRNNTGQGWVGKVIKKTPDTVTLKEPRILHAGLCVGSSDLIGWKPVTITPDMVGKTLAVFVAAEVKTAGVAVTTEQRRFVDYVDKAGGRGGIIYTEEELARLLA